MQGDVVPEVWLQLRGKRTVRCCKNAKLSVLELVQSTRTGLTSSSLNGQLTELGWNCLLLLPTALFAQMTVLELARLAQNTELAPETKLLGQSS